MAAGTGPEGVAEQAPPVQVNTPPPPRRSPLDIQLNEDFRLRPGVSYQARYYHREGRDFVPGGAENLIRHRARLQLAAHYRDLLDVFVQLQDVRTWGEESDPAGDFSADAFDLHQGYLTFTPLDHMRFRLGRQEVDLANERLVGRPLFLEQSRSFDGLHFRYDDEVELEVGYFLVRDYAAGQPLPVLTDGKRHLGISHISYQVRPFFHPHLLTVLDLDTATDRMRTSVGAIIDGEVESRNYRVNYSVEGYYQRGNDEGIDVSAWQVAASARVTTPWFGKPFIEALTVLVSGDSDPTDSVASTFASPYPRGHRILGEMDFFINFPRDTDERGLRDYSGKIGWTPEKVALTAEVHYFDAMVTRPDGLRHYGVETNLKVSYPFWDYAAADALYGFFVPGEIKQLGLTDPRLEHFAYVTTKVVF